MRLLPFLAVLAMVTIHTVSSTRGALFRSRRVDPAAWAGREDFLRFGRAIDSTESLGSNYRMADSWEKRFFTDFYHAENGEK